MESFVAPSLTDSPRVVVHNTDIGTFKRCRTQWDFSSSLRMNLEPVRPVEPLNFGTIWHSGLATYYSTQPEDQAGRRTGNRLGAAQNAIDEGFDEWERQVTGDDGSLGPEDEEELKEMRELAHGMIDNYAHYAPTVDNFEVVWVERSYEVPLFSDIGTRNSMEVFYGFKPDALLQDPLGKFWIGEWKSAKTLPGDNTDYLLTDDQVGRYLWGLREAEGLEVEGVIYRISRKAAPHELKVLKDGNLSLDKRQITTHAIAKRQIEAKYGKVPNKYHEFLSELLAQGYSTFFFNQPVRRNRTELENIGRSLQAESREMLSDPYIHRSPSQYNCNFCSFIGPCLTKWSGQDVDMALAGNYQERQR